MIVTTALLVKAFWAIYPWFAMGAAFQGLSLMNSKGDVEK